MFASYYACGPDFPIPAFQPGYSLPGSKSKPKRPARQIDFKTKYKTEICRGWEEGFCEFGDKCAFAHGPWELRQKSSMVLNYKTKRCKQFFEQGYCMYGSRCQFLHKEPGLSNTASSTPEASASPSRKSSQDDTLGRLQIFITLANAEETLN